MVDLTSSILASMLSVWVNIVGNFPALFRPGPSNLGICFIMLSDAKNASYFFAAPNNSTQVLYADQKWLPSFFTSFLSLLNFFSASTSMHGIELALASSQCDASPSTHTLNFGRGTYLNLKFRCNPSVIFN